MKNTKGSLFDPIAEAYYTFTPTLPEKYINLIQETFTLQQSDHILDLGCGSGDLTLSLANYSSFVQGVDISKKMICMAKEKDVQNKVTWHLASVEDIDLGEETQNLIISFESFHLFPNPVEIIKKCARALRPGGALCIGWRMFEWDIPLKEAVKETFDIYGIDRGTWGRWTCPTFAQEIEASNTGLSALKQKTIAIKTQAPLDVIANHVLNNSRSARISNELKPTLQKALVQAFLQVYPSGKSEGYTTYTIMYAKK